MGIVVIATQPDMCSMKVAQVLVNRALTNFLNDGHTTASFLLYPLRRNVKEHVTRDLRKAFSNCIPSDAFLDITNAGKTASEAKVTEFISAFYRGFDDWLKKKRITGEIHIQCRAFKARQYDTEYLSPVLALKEYAQVGLNDLLRGLYVHGSISTLDYVEGWSDLDTLCVIAGQTAKDPRKLAQLRRRLHESHKFLYAFDPLQHHGHSVVTSVDLRFYPSTFLPPIVLEHSKPLLGDGEIVLIPRDDRLERESALRSLCDSIKRIADRENADIYTRKTAYHMVLLLPTLFLQALDKPTYKRESFDKARMYFTEDMWAAIDMASKIRKNWSLRGRGRNLVRITPWNPKLGQKMFCLFSRLGSVCRTKEDYAEFSRRARKLAESVLEKTAWCGK